ncbi:putative methyltransferase-domain-containing protein [Xylariales sp. PMI_506]|nr:putative methyltransferase-domain-containing protein [Xylariales sp. PMI_506]
MHYIRLLRPATLDTSNPRAPLLSLKLTITTDLGDTFLSPASPIVLVCCPQLPSHDGSTHVSSSAPLRLQDGTSPLWKAGMRVLKAELPVPRAMARGRAWIRIEAHSRNREISARRAALMLPWRAASGPTGFGGLVAPITVELNDGVGSDIAVREILCQSSSEADDDSAAAAAVAAPRTTTMTLAIEEDIGESIARHIWDAGLVTAALLADACRQTEGGPRIQDLMPFAKSELNVLELGCGVGVLGIGIGMFIYDAARAQGFPDLVARVLLTDLPEAEERARSNMARCLRGSSASKVTLEYENLDWEDGAQGKFGPTLSLRSWDYVVLSDCTYNVDTFPVLVGTLSAIHMHNLSFAQEYPNGCMSTKVLLSTKPRHDSEKELWDMLKDAGWNHNLLTSVPLPRLDAEDEVVEVYLLEKTERSLKGESKKRKPQDEDSRPHAKKKAP